MSTRTPIPEWTLGDRLRKARDTAGLSQQELAHRLHLSRNTIGSYEKLGAGDEAPNPWLLRAWAEICSVDPQWLLGDRPPGGTITSGYPVVPRLKWRERVAA